MQTKTVFTREAAYIGKLSGLVTVPEDFDPAKETLPVIVFLHGAGEVDDGAPEAIEKVRVHGIPKYFCADPAFHGLRAITVSPQCPAGLIWDQITLQVMDYLNAVIDEFHGDRERVSLTGISMGGFGTWNLLTTYPAFFRRAAPICGGGVPWRIRDTLKDKPIRIYHSVDDPSVPYTCSVLMAQRAVRAGADVDFITYCGEGHGCWDRAYEEGDLIEWLGFKV